jgi:hypothetical protein
MLSLKDEIPIFRTISESLDGIFSAKKARDPVETCPSCGRTNVRVEILETMGGLKMGFFTCSFCNESWSGPIKEKAA